MTEKEAISAEVREDMKKKMAAPRSGKKITGKAVYRKS